MGCYSLILDCPSAIHFEVFWLTDCFMHHCFSLAHFNNHNSGCLGLGLGFDYFDIDNYPHAQTTANHNTNNIL